MCSRSYWFAVPQFTISPLSSKWKTERFASLQLYRGGPFRLNVSPRQL